MAAITTAVVAIAAVILGWITIEIACKPCLEKGREAIDRSLDPNYDPDSPRLPPAAADAAASTEITEPLLDPSASSATSATKVV
ncbi:hypothetical protein AXF42_Ash018335 [Apostasia shenzhenica]|uniref:Outer envelope membrane protein 7 n=1 Tax=Apostasia shenzhenica TaxID=1088818 RepID=A0A2H9ZR61_9ASPA|nr:hypothetical protein AXF42_Ash018335 [Apostasia shenzhenica]